MSVLVKNRISVIIALCFLAFTVNAQQKQLASNKSLNDFYSQAVKQKLDEWKTTNHPNNSMHNRDSLASIKPSLKNIAQQKMKNTKIYHHDNSGLSKKQIENKLPGNSSNLKQLGHRKQHPTIGK